MAHPGLWGFGLASVALIAAGVWLKQSDPSARPPVAVVSAPADRAPSGQPVAGTAAEGAPPQGAGLAADPSPGPVPRDTPSDPVSDPVPEPPDEAEPGAAPAKAAPSSAPLPPQAAGPDVDQAALVDPRLFVGPDHWLPATLDGVPPEAIREAIRGAIAARGVGLHFGAIAAPLDRTRTRFVVQGYNELGQAEGHALALCARFETGCVILAWMVPEDWDGTVEGTLGARQRPAWEAFVALPDGTRRAFAASAEGATGFGLALTEGAARDDALRDCARDQDRLREAGVSPGPCRIVALRAP